MVHAGAAGTGGLETSALALGQARAALVALAAEAPRRLDLAEPVDALADDWRGGLVRPWSPLALGSPRAPHPRPSPWLRPTPWSCGSPRPI